MATGMAGPAAAALDLVTLSWCLPEIKTSLLKAEQCIQAQLTSAVKDTKTELRVALSAIHQALGAVRVIGVDGPELLMQQAENLVSQLERSEINEGVLTKSHVQALNHSFAAVVDYLEVLAQGEPSQPLFLYPFYRDLMLARGIERVHPAELFSVRQVAVLEVHSGPERLLGDAERLQTRNEFERGLLKFLRGTGSEVACNEMFSSLSRFEGEHRNSPDRNFWAAAMAFFEGLKAGAFEGDAIAKRLLARFNSHLKVALPGDAVPEKLYKEVLFSLAMAQCSTPMLEAVREAFALKGTVPTDFETPRFALIDRSALALSIEALAKIKALLDKIVRGGTDEIAPFNASVQLLVKSSTVLPQGGLQPAVEGLALAAKALIDDPSAALANETMLLELATIALFCDTLIDQGLKVSQTDRAHGIELANRIKLALAGRLDINDAMPDWLQSLSQLAQERITVATFIIEAQNNLRSVEKTLDTYFRDHSESKELASCGAQLRQVSGALSLLGYTDASSATQALAKKVDSLAKEPLSAKQSDCDQIAQTLGAIGFFVDRLSQKDSAVANFKFDSESGAFTVFEVAPQAEALPTRVVQMNLLPVVSQVPEIAIAHAFSNHADMPAAFDVTPPVPLLPVFDLPPVLDLLPELPISQAMVFQESDAAEDDDGSAELREIFLCEAQEVLDAIAEHSAVLQDQPSNADSLTTIRRSFHTLKGSSRMVGLDRFGEAGWAMEQLLNSWIADKKPVDTELLSTVADSHAEFTRWVAALEQGDETAVQPDAMIAKANALREAKPVEVIVSVLEEPIPYEQLFAQQIVEEPVVEAVAQAVPALESETVQIGDQTISRALFNIFLSEADEMLSVLRADAADWLSCEPRKAQKEARRAIHSIAGSANLVGLCQVSEIAHQTDLFLQRHIASEVLASEKERLLYNNVVDRLDAMLHQFAAGVAPKDESEAFDDAVALACGVFAEQPLSLEQADFDQIDTFTDVKGNEQITELLEIDSVSELISFPYRIEAVSDHDSVHEEDRFDDDLLPVFIEEAEDYLPQISTSLRQWRETPGSDAPPRNLMRLMHTVKGSARMAGAMQLGQRVHEMETKIEHATDAASRLDASGKLAVIDSLVQDHDHLTAVFDQIKNPSVIQANASNMALMAGAKPSEASLHGDLSLLNSRPINDDAKQDDIADATSTFSAAAAQAQAGNNQVVRVRADILDRMVSDAGEASIARARVENELTTMRGALSDLSENVSRLRTQLREIEVQAESQIQSRIALSKESHAEFDPLEFDRFTRFQEVSRMLAESVNDVATVQQNSMRGLDEANRDLQRQSQVMRELQQNLMRIRMVQVSSISERLYRVVRQAAKETGKKVNLEIRGSNTEIDRSVLERMASAFEHLLRNAVAHGIEPSADRLAAGKPETGEIVFEVRQEGNEIRVFMSDNGSGLNYPKIRERALARGLMAADSNPSERELAQMIFMPGFSTANNVTELAGRGVGMDVVRNDVATLGGRLETESRSGFGTRFSIALPLSLAVTQIVVMESGEHRFALPSASIEQVLQLKPQALVSAYAEQGIEWQGERVPIVHIASLLDLSDRSPVAQHNSPVVMAKVGDRRLAIHADSVTKNQEVVLKNMGPQLSRVDGIVGATVMGNGDIVLIINPLPFADRLEVAGRTGSDQRLTESLMREADRERFTVMVVDDSVTVRKVSQRFLSREGYDVILAKDGVDALRQLQEQLPDLMLLDIEMPRMDGYDLTRAIRADERLQHIPIIMITSRTADKHRNYAISLGVNDYMGKPYGEQELSVAIRRLLKAEQSVALSM